MDPEKVIWDRIVRELELAITVAEQNTNQYGITRPSYLDEVRRWLGFGQHYKVALKRKEDFSPSLLARIERYMDIYNPWE